MKWVIHQTIYIPHVQVIEYDKLIPRHCAVLFLCQLNRTYTNLLLNCAAQPTLKWCSDRERERERERTKQIPNNAKGNSIVIVKCGKFLPRQRNKETTNAHAVMRVQNMELFGLNPINKCFYFAIHFIRSLELYFCIFRPTGDKKEISNYRFNDICTRAIESCKRTTMTRMRAVNFSLYTYPWNYEIYCKQFFLPESSLHCSCTVSGFFSFFFSQLILLLSCTENWNYAMLCQESSFSLSLSILLCLSFTVCNLFVFVFWMWTYGWLNAWRM